MSRWTLEDFKNCCGGIVQNKAGKQFFVMGYCEHPTVMLRPVDKFGDAEHECDIHLVPTCPNADEYEPVKTLPEKA